MVENEKRYAISDVTYWHCTLLFLTLPAQAYTTEVHVVKYAADGETILNETTVNYTWMEENLPVQGDGSTHYYFQGPIFGEEWVNTYSLNYTGGDWGSSEEKWDRVDRGSGYVYRKSSATVTLIKTSVHVREQRSGTYATLSVECHLATR